MFNCDNMSNACVFMIYMVQCGDCSYLRVDYHKVSKYLGYTVQFLDYILMGYYA